MHILVAGINYKTAPVEIRERLSFQEQDLSFAMQQLQRQKSILENVIISTCNRTEVYAVVDQLHTGRYYIKDFLSKWFDIEKEAISPYLFFYENEYATEHLFRVSSGLDSMVLGETQILGQVRTSFFMAQDAHTSGTLFNHLFKEAITVAKRGHSETEIGSNAVSVSYAAVELAKKIFGSLANQQVLIVGAGKMGELAAENLYGNGVSKVTVVNRTLEKAKALAEKFSGESKSLQELQCALLEADIVISSTGSNEYVISKEMMNQVEKMRKGRPLFMVDIAVPRDIDPAIEELESVFLYDIDDLEGIVEANLAERKVAAEQIEIMIEEAIVAFNQWVNTLGVVPVITALREKALAIQAETMNSIERKLPHLTEREQKILNKHTKSIINQLLKEPILQVKELAAGPQAEESLALFTKIFGIEESIENQKQLHQQSSIKAKTRKTAVELS